MHHVSLHETDRVLKVFIFLTIFRNYGEFSITISQYMFQLLKTPTEHTLLLYNTILKLTL
jgi:hypothetical protein